MKNIIDTEKYINWKQCKVSRSKTFANWNLNDIVFPWERVTQIDEVSKEDPWNIYTTDLKYQLAYLHRTWGIPKESVEHFMSFQPDLPEKLKSSIEPFKNFDYSYNLLKLTPGRMIVWHFDTYATFVKRKRISESSAEIIKRSIVMLTPWSFGHVIQIGGEILHEWVPGDIYTWHSDTWHGAANFGKDDLIVLQVTYIE